MEMEVAIATTEEMAKGFLLAGFRRVWYPPGEDYTQSLREWFERQVKDEVGIIFIASRLYEKVKDMAERLERERRAYPVVVTIPEGEEEEDPIRRIIKRAMGIEIREGSI
ncbi:MAG: hypothetical protein DRN40_05370 [Thermoplasmata archaeon]|nr:MAG: hypothetical protein DRN40_05370 [Thermoplasmata archaeon]RLF70405.1 MAG: hypothetical protein DRN55_08590 [Thermoplasmata archaeon]